MTLKERSPVSRWSRAGKASVLAGIVALTVTGCSAEEVLRFGWPEGVTPQAEEMRQLWTWATVAALVVGVIVWGLILWSVAFHRKKKGDSGELPRQFQYNVPLELFCVVIPVVMVCVLFFFTVTTEFSVLDEDEDPDVAIEVVAFQWNWEFRHLDAETPDGEPVSTVGSTDDIPILVLPTDRSIGYELRSTDVIHSFWVPEFLFKRDVFPEPERNNQDNTFQNTIEREGSFVGRCAELCGTYHSMMNFEVRAVSPEQYDEYLGLMSRVNEETGRPYTTPQALEAMGLPSQAETTAPFDPDRTAREPSG
ncbi:cytochrome c oxidase subunit 2 [Haloechinothrix alba]|uniref:cytochrome-c oxidase n=1 Tax=Haloechinothrix alba TaxID=664784 RepID=A0A238WII3_9PSEU|nr:cytochrome c oxidase subunit II [Haloechinothrix alba]SNR46131.1 cytochrome c oxidase subunit 2 [Haloechinothrix alba]